MISNYISESKDICMINGGAMRLPLFLLWVSVITLLSLSSLSCRQRENRIVFYEDGKTVKIEVEYLNGKKDGVEKTYYSNGQLRSEIHWKNGRKNGETKEYHHNGSIGVIRRFKDGLKFDKTAFFDESRNLIEEHYFDSTGRFVDFKKYDSNGSRKNIMAPLPWILRDTINIKDTLDFALSLGNLTDFRFNSGTLMRCSEFLYDENGNPESMKDTLEITQSEDNNYHLRIVSERKGENIIRGQLIYSLGELPGDSVYTFSFEQRYYVK